VDFNGDNLKDIIIGTGYGYVNFYSRKADGSLHDEGHIKAGSEVIKAEFESSVAVTDWNEDGLLDLIVGIEEQPEDQYFGHIRVYLNKGTKQKFKFSDFSKIAGGTWPIRYQDPMIEVVDMDYDGKKDLIIGHHKGNFVYFKNTGSNSKPAFSQSSYTSDTEKLQYKDSDGKLKDIDENYGVMPFLGDLNGDGRLDFVEGGVYLLGVNVYFGIAG
jgi:hypothetical protein